MRSISLTPLNHRQLNISHQNPPQTQHDATTRWSSFGYRPTVQCYLLRRQYGLCCYSELRMDLIGYHYHIEHVENKSQAPHRTFDEQNLAASGLSSGDAASFLKENIFGGHAAGKQSGVDMTRFISCYRPDCSRFFAYLSDGRIVPATGLSAEENADAQYTIDLLNLNSGYLQNLRQQWWDELEQLDIEHQGKNRDLALLIELDLIPDMNQKLHSPFFSLTRQFFGPVAESVLRQSAPELL
ncbi:retron system putative HNH endonuclease [Morganella morganii]|uniref:retron system putative HNH endonuclease n=1 Tax=Morganella morganii TaxID=582 RepID=UPI0021D2DC81|nr:retron system putative HNH endonuclease [Morganella morganii]MCU6223269.1 TIGR02646 family protein [Morganella morganii]MCU6233822.1 TIGR02646 family protein [Morganella morganii]